MNPGSFFPAAPPPPPPLPFQGINSLYTSARTKFFLIKSSSDKNISISLNFNIWATTPKNEHKFVSAFTENDFVILIFSVNGSSKFCGYAVMRSMPGESQNSNVYFYYDDKIFRGRNFDIQWIRVVDVSFQEVSHLKNSLNENKPIKVGRDGQEIERMAGIKLCEVFEAKYLSMASFEDQGVQEEIQSNQANQTNQTNQANQANQTNQLKPSKQTSSTTYETSTNLLPSSPRGAEKRDCVKLFPLGNTLNMNYSTFKRMYAESQFNLVNIYNPALHVFPIDLTNMSYDEYIDLYETTQQVWERKMLQLRLG
ncbi:Uncharacterized protein PCOAH_00020270 [Plasmodium coatneyi]|uniref:YTH domain-containing protein n=1 Tax=Plasmodium coatneyi TaxID=208452 RepID=A0A1B1DYI2_9APIC|nr:Uncharacterized protein PCOAH_00020270 [Plasmodium coatneyi]ANQ07828.1 Uncharacterized protein PCOAH_00020270 [Plasmodium coatneyi]